MFKPPEYDSKELLPNGPEMWMSEIKYIEGIFDELCAKKNHLNVLEWGSGRGTVYFAKYIKSKGCSVKWYAVENFLPWYDKVDSMIREEGLENDVEILLKNSTSEPDHVKQELGDFEEYINYPKEIGVIFDFILVDARKRKQCLELASTLVEKEGYVCMHDAEREENHAPECYVDGGKFVVENISPNSRNGIQKLWVGTI